MNTETEHLPEILLLPKVDLHGYARVDFRVDSEGNPFVLEVNTNPCISKDAGFIAACQRGGLEYKEVIRRILDDARNKP